MFQCLKKAGVTSFHVTLANHSDLENTIPPKNHPYFGEPGCFLKFCDEVRQYTNLPICGVGGLTDPDFVEKQLADGRIQCAAMSRQLLADPDWVNKLKNAISIRGGATTVLFKVCAKYLFPSFPFTLIFKRRAWASPKLEQLPTSKYFFCLGDHASTSQDLTFKSAKSPEQHSNVRTGISAAEQINGVLP